ncbi:MAG: lytic transglycosylase domain-containing protein [Nitrospirota bacterium]
MVCLAGLVACWSTSVMATEIYRYRAPDGTLHFSDRPLAPGQHPIADPASRGGRTEAQVAYRQRPSGKFAWEVGQASTAAGIDAGLLHAVIAVESAYQPSARSPKGALGLMQLMPATAAEMGVEDPFDPEENIRAGALYLRRLWDRFGDLNLALAAYNAGPERVEAFGGVPPFAETESYLRQVRRLYPQGDWRQRHGAMPTRIFAVHMADGSVLYTDTPR